jgi:hypothetical protein
MELRTFLSRCLLYFPVIFIAGYILVKTILKSYYHPYFLGIFLYFAGITMLSGILLIAMSLRHPGRFSFYFFSFTAIKLIIHLGILVVFFMMDRESVLVLAAAFFIHYLIFKAFEMISMQSFSKQMRK